MLLPGKHNLGIQWTNGPSSETVSQHLTDIGSRLSLMKKRSQLWSVIERDTTKSKVIKDKCISNGELITLSRKTRERMFNNKTSWAWWDEWDVTALQTQDSKFEPWWSSVSTSCQIRSDHQTLTTGVPYRCTNGRGANNINIHYDVTGLLSAMWRSHSGQIVWAVWVGQGGGGFCTHSTYAWYPGDCR